MKRIAILLLLAVLCFSCAKPAPLSVEALDNATYPSDVTPSKTVTLEDGKYSAPAAPGSASMITVQLADQYATGDLNGDGAPDAAVVLISSGGGSGTFYTLVAVINDKGKPNPTATTQLGDRIKLQSVAIASGQITVQLVKQGPTDPACCPTLQATQVFKLQGGQLAEVK